MQYGIYGAGKVWVGGSGDDTHQGGAGDDKLSGMDGDDALSGGDGDDTLSGGAGNDRIGGGMGADLVHGGGGDDYLYSGEYYDAPGQVFGDAGDDIIFGQEGATLDGGAGNDWFSLDYLWNTIEPLNLDLTHLSTGTVQIGTTFVSHFESGRLQTSQGDDHIVTGATALQVLLNYGDDFVQAGKGALYAEGEDGDDTLLGGKGDDTLVGGDGVDIMSGGGGDDQITSSDGYLDDPYGAETLLGGAGDDWLWDWSTGDTIDGGAGFDFAGVYLADQRNLHLDFGQLKHGGAMTLPNGNVLVGIEGVEIVGGHGGDWIKAGTATLTIDDRGGDNTIVAAGGDDWISCGASGHSILRGGEGTDTLQIYNGQFGSPVHVDLAIEKNQQVGDGTMLISGFENLVGSVYSDELFGTDGANVIKGGNSADLLSGRGGDDTLVSDGGSDTLSGGKGVDSFIIQEVYEVPLGPVVTITDLEKGEIIDLSSIDADWNTPYDQAITIVGHFTGRGGQATLTYDRATDTTTLALDRNGDASAEFSLVMNGDQRHFDGFVL